MGVGVVGRKLPNKPEKKTAEEEIAISKQEPYDNIPIRAMVIVQKAIQEDNENTIDNIHYGITLIQQEFARRTLNPEVIMRRIEVVKEIIRNITLYSSEMKQEIEELKYLVQNYEEEYRKNIENTELNRLSEEEKLLHLRKLEDIYEQISKE